MYVGRDYDVAEKEEIQTFGLDFVNDIADGDTLTGASWSCEVSPESVTDDPGAQYCLVGGSTRWGGTKAYAQFENLLDGVTYILRAVVTTSSGDTVSLFSHAVGRKRT